MTEELKLETINDKLSNVVDRLNTLEERINVVDIGKKNINIKIWRSPDNQINVQTVIARPEKGTCKLRSHTWNPIKLLTRGKAHKKLYNEKTQSETYTIKTFEEFMDTIIGDKGKRTFTYCLKSDGDLNLCETIGPEDDYKCKHMYVCYDKKHICSAGIIVFKKEGGHMIYIDNMSGTYFTRKENLEILKNCIASSFPGEYDRIKNLIETINPSIEKGGTQDERDIFCKEFGNSIDYYKICPQTDNPLVDPVSQHPSHRLSGVGIMKVDYNADKYDNTLPAKKGDMIHVISKVNDDWSWVIDSIRNETGFVPNSFFELDKTWKPNAAKGSKKHKKKN